MAIRQNFTDDPRGWHIDGWATNALVGYRPSGWIADQIFPVVNVGHQSDVFGKVDQADWFRRPNTDRPLGAKPNEVHFTVGSDTYFCRNRALETYVPWATIDNADAPVKPVMLAGMFLEDQLLLDYELAVRDRVITGCSSTLILSGAQAWDDPINSNPMGNFETQWETMRSTTGQTPNVVVLPQKVFLKLRRHPQLLRAAYPGGTVGGLLNAQQLGDLMQVDKVLVPKTINVTSVPGTPETNLAFTDVWSTNVHLLHVEPLQAAGQFVATFGVAFRWGGPNIGTGGPGNFDILRKPDDDREVERFKTSYWQDEKIVASRLGLTIATGITA